MKKLFTTMALCVLTALSAVENIETAFSLIKPDAVAQDHVQEILGIYATNGLRVINTKRMLLTKEDVATLYAEHINKPYYSELEEYMTSGPIVAIEMIGENAVTKVRDLMGATDPAKAKEGTIRHLFGESVAKNAVHGSDSLAAAEKELHFFFGN